MRQQTQEFKQKKLVGCVTCHRAVDFSKFKTQVDHREFKISGMCKHCQDGVFSPYYEDGVKI